MNHDVVILQYSPVPMTKYLEARVEYPLNARLHEPLQKPTLYQRFRDSTEALSPKPKPQTLGRNPEP